MELELNDFLISGLCKCENNYHTLDVAQIGKLNVFVVKIWDSCEHECKFFNNLSDAIEYAKKSYKPRKCKYNDNCDGVITWMFGE